MIGREFKALRQLLGLLQKEVALELGLNHITICRWETIGQDQPVNKLVEQAMSAMAKDRARVKEIKNSRPARKPRKSKNKLEN